MYFLVGSGTWNQKGAVTITTNSTVYLSHGTCVAGPMYCYRRKGLKVGCTGEEHRAAFHSHTLGLTPPPMSRCVFCVWTQWNMEPIR